MQQALWDIIWYSDVGTTRDCWFPTELQSNQNLSLSKILAMIVMLAQYKMIGSLLNYTQAFKISLSKIFAMIVMLAQRLRVSSPQNYTQTQKFSFARGLTTELHSSPKVKLE